MSKTTQQSRRAQRHRDKVRHRRARWVVFGGGLMLLIAIVVIVSLAARGGTSDAGDSETVADLVLGDYTITGDLTVPAGRLSIRATNVGVEPHDVGIRLPAAMPRITTTLFNGQTADLEVGDLTPGTYELFCDIGDHIARGMVATLTVTDPVPPSPAPTG